MDQCATFKYNPLPTISLILQHDTNCFNIYLFDYSFFRKNSFDASLFTTITLYKITKLSCSHFRTVSSLRMKTSKFGINSFFFVQQLTLLGIGIDVNSINKAFKRPYLTFFLNMCLILIFFSWGANCWNLRNDDLDKILEAVMPFFQTFTSSFKVFIFMYKHKKMITLVKRLYTIIGQGEFHPLSTKILSIIFFLNISIFLII